jgi:hypothetical protein
MGPLSLHVSDRNSDAGCFKKLRLKSAAARIIVMSALPRKRTWARPIGMSAKCCKADKSLREVRYKNVPLLHQRFTAYELCVMLERLVGPGGRMPREMADAS